MDYSLPGSSVHAILQARTLEWVAIPFSRGSSWPRDRTQVSCIAGRFFYHLSHQGSPFHLGEGVGIFRNWTTAHFLTINVHNHCGSWVVLQWAILRIKGKCKLSPPSWTWLFLISLCHVLLLKVVPCLFPVSVILIYVKKECLKMYISKLSSSDRLPHLNNTLSYMASAISHFKFLKWKQSFHSIYGTDLNFWRGNPLEMILLPFSHSF